MDHKGKRQSRKSHSHLAKGEFATIDLNQTLPRSFKYRHHRSNSSRNQSPIETSSNTSGKDFPSPPALGLKRSKPVQPFQKPSITKYQQVGNDQTLNDYFKLEQSSQEMLDDPEVEQDVPESCLSKSVRNLPSRSHSLRYSPRSPRMSSPPSGSPRVYSPSLSNFQRFSRGRRSQRLSHISTSSGDTEANESPGSLSSFPSQENIPQEEKQHSGGLPTKPTAETFANLSKHFDMNSSGSTCSNVDEQDTNPPVKFRHRAKSWSPKHSPRNSFMVVDDTLVLVNDRLPKAKEMMENQLTLLLEEFSKSNRHSADSNVNFGRHQILDFARDLLEKSKMDNLSKDQLFSFSGNIRTTVSEVTDRNAVESPELNHLVNRLMIATARVTRLLEIMEADYQPESGAGLLNLSGDDETSEWMRNLPLSHTPYILNRLKGSPGPRTAESCARCPPKKRPSSLHLNLENQPHSQPSEDDFSVIKIISSGAFGAVYLVRHKHTRKRFAMKKVNKKRMVMKKQVQQVFTERDILTFAENPFVVGLWCTFQTEHHLYMIMEYVEGGDLASLLDAVGCLSLEMAKKYFAETVLALEYIHFYGIIHRDLKPENLLITSEGHIKLADFGLSKIGLTNYTAHVIEDAWCNKDEQFIDHEVLGTPDYIAPEVILGLPYGQPVDWWSMGVILYRMLMGVTPFNSCTVQHLFEEITNEHLVINFAVDEDEEEIPDDAQDLIKELMIFDPTERLGSDSTGGVLMVKEHPFFDDLHWPDILRQKAEFIPQLQGDEDTSYFDNRLERYPQDMGSDEEDGGYDSLYQSEFENFGTVTPRMSMLLDESFSVPSSDPEDGKDSHRDSGILVPEANILGHKEDGKESLLLKDVQTLSQENNVILADDEVTCGTPRLVDKPSEAGFLVPRGGFEPDPKPTSSSRRNSGPRPASAGCIDRDTAAIRLCLSTPEDDHQNSSLSSSYRNSMAATPIRIETCRKGCGMTLKSIRVYFGDSNNYRIHHIVQAVDKDGPAWKAGVRSNMLVTHINGEAITGMQHVQVVSLMAGKKKNARKKKQHSGVVTMHAIPLDQTSIRQDNRKRVPELGKRIGKFLTKQSTRIRKKSSFLRNFRSGSRGINADGTSFAMSSGSPSPKAMPLHPSLRRVESARDTPRKRISLGVKQPAPLSPLAHSTSPLALSSNPTPSTSPQGSTLNLSVTTPPGKISPSCSRRTQRLTRPKSEVFEPDPLITTLI